MAEKLEQLTEEQLDALRNVRGFDFEYIQFLQTQQQDLWNMFVKDGYVRWDILFRCWTKTDKTKQMFLDIATKELDETRCPHCGMIYSKEKDSRRYG